MAHDFITDILIEPSPFDAVYADIMLYGEDYWKSLDDSEFLLYYGITKQQFMHETDMGFAADSQNLYKVLVSPPSSAPSVDQLIEEFANERTTHSASKPIAEKTEESTPATKTPDNSSATASEQKKSQSPSKVDKNDAAHKKEPAAKPNKTIHITPKKGPEYKARKEFEQYKRDLLLSVRGSLARRAINLREKALNRKIEESAISAGTLEWLELVKEFFPNAPLTATVESRKSVRDESPVADTTTAPETSSPSGLTEATQAESAEKNTPKLIDAVFEETAQAVAENDTGLTAANEPVTEQETPSAEPQQRQSGSTNVVDSNLAENGASMSQEPSVAGGVGGGIDATKEAQATEVQVDASGGAKGLIGGFTQNAPSQMLNAFNKTVEVSTAAMQVDTEKAKESLPEVQAPTGLPGMDEAERKGDEVKAEKQEAKDNLKAEAKLSQAPKLPENVGVNDNVFSQQQAFPKENVHAQTDASAETEAAAEKAIQNINIDTSKVPDELGSAPKVQMQGPADPQIINESSAETKAETEQGVAEAQAITGNDFGETRIFPDVDEQILSTEKELQDHQTAAEAAAAPTEKIPEQLVGGVDELMGTEMLPKIEQEQQKFQQGQSAQEAKQEETIVQAEKDIEQLNTEAVEKQKVEQEKANKIVTEQKEGYQQEVNDMKAQLDADMKAKVAETDGQITSEKQKGEAVAQQEFSKAEAQAKQEKQKAESKAQKAKEEKKNEKKGLWGAITGVVTAVVNAVKDAINTIFDALRSFVKRVFDAAKKLAIAAIDLATKAITGLIKMMGEFLKSLVKTLFAAFPVLQEKLLKAIDSVVNAAIEAVNKIADNLKKAVVAALDVVCGLIDLALSIIQELYNIALTAISMIVKGEFADLAKYIAKSAVNLVFGSLKQFLALMGINTDALDKIIEEPKAFFMNLISAVKLGIKNFVANIQKHLLNGLTGWLFGSMSEAGIELPQTFNLQGIIFLVLQILNLTWANIRAKIVKKLGPKGEMIMSGAEKTVEIIADVLQRGPIALVDHLKQFLGDLKDMIFSSIITWVRDTIIVKAIAKLISYFNPAGAILAVIEGIFNTIMFLKERWEQIKNFCEAVMLSITKIAYGEVGEAAVWVENSLGRAIPVTISFLARLIGLGGITDKIKQTIAKVRKPVDMALDKVIDFIINGIKKIGNKLFGKGGETKNGDAKKIKEDNKNEKNVKADDEDKKKHKEIADNIKSDLNKSMIMDDENFSEFHKRKKSESKDLENKYQPQLKKGVNLDILFGSVKEDEKDNDIDYKIKIAPNDLLESDTLPAGDENDVLKVGEHIISNGSGRESHHVPPNGLKDAIADLYGKAGSALSGKEGLEDLSAKLIAKSSFITSTYSNHGVGLSAISIDVGTHRTANNAVHGSNIQNEVLEEIKAEVEEDIDKKQRIVVVLKTGKRLIANLNDEHWQLFLLKVYELENRKKTDKTNIENSKTADELIIKVKGGDEEALTKVANEIGSEAEKELNNVKTRTAKKRIATDIQNKINNTVKSAYNMGLSNSLNAVKVALSKSDKDGDKSKHAGILSSLSNLAENIWSKIISIV